MSDPIYVAIELISKVGSQVKDGVETYCPALERPLRQHGIFFTPFSKKN